MYAQDIPGRVVHIRIEGTAVAVTFEHIPWTFYLADMAGAIEAFSNNEWAYFHERWWTAHRYLLDESATLTRLAASLDPSRHYNAAHVLEQGLANGVYFHCGRDVVECDYHRLLLMPVLLQWPENGLGTVIRHGRPASIGWPGHMWSMAIVDRGGASLPHLLNGPGHMHPAGVSA